MIALDLQPFSIVEDGGFVRLIQQLEPRYKLPSRRYITQSVIPHISTGMTMVVRRMITDVDYISLTTDIWSTEISNDSLLSLTAHWITNDFEKRSCILNARPLVESHTGEYISQVFIDMLAAWEVPTDKVHLVLRDNGANMIKAIRDTSLLSFGCFAHTLQLVVHDGILSQCAVTDMLAICRRIVGHFKHGSVVYFRL